jgi:methylmalonyl-CoA/ethylmalonyl-CoA epimerase
MEAERRIELPPLRQLGIVVEDLEKTRANLERHFEIGPFHVFEFDQKAFVADGSEISSRIKVGLAEAGPVQIELIQPIRGENIYTEFLARRGEGLHHLAYEVDSFAIVEALVRAGARKVFHYDYGGFAFAYLDVPGFGDTPLEFLRSGREPRSPGGE